MDANGVMEAIKDSATNINGQVEQLKEEIMNEILDSLTGGDYTIIGDTIINLIEDNINDAIAKLMSNPETPAIDSITEIVQAIDAKRDSNGNWFSVDDN